MNPSFLVALACPVLMFLSGCSSVIPAPADSAKEGAATKARVIGWNGDFLALGEVQGASGDAVEVKWGTTKIKASKSDLAPVVSASELKVGLRVVAPLGASSMNAAVGTVVAVVDPGHIRLKWDLDDKEEEISSSSVALLIRPLCKPEKGCKYGVGKTPGASAESAAPVAGVSIGSWLGVKYEVRGATYWAPGEVKEILEDGFSVNVRGHGEVKVKAADFRLPLKTSELKPGTRVQHGAPPGGLVEGFVAGVDGDMALISSSEDGSSPQKRKIGAEVFHAP